MKNLFLAILMLSLGANAFGYSSPAGVDPKNNTHDQEYKAVVKSAVDGESSSVSFGHLLSHAAVVDGYTVTRIAGGAIGNVLAQAKVMCVAAQDIATGNSSYNKCISKGFVDFLKYDATVAIVAFSKICANTEGIAVACTGTEATQSGITALEAKVNGTGSNLKAMINLK